MVVFQHNRIVLQVFSFNMMTKGLKMRCLFNESKANRVVISLMVPFHQLQFHGSTTNLIKVVIKMYAYITMCML